MVKKAKKCKGKENKQHKTEGEDRKRLARGKRKSNGTRWIFKERLEGNTELTRIIIIRNNIEET